MPLEMLYNAKGDRLYVTTAKPGFVNLYDNTDPRKPKFLQAIPSAPGAHHSVLSPDERYLFVQNSLLNLEGMSDGSITVIDLQGRTSEGQHRYVEGGRVQPQLHHAVAESFPAGRLAGKSQFQVIHRKAWLYGQQPNGEVMVG